MVTDTVPLMPRPRAVRRPRVPARDRRRRWLGWGLIGGAAALVPWMWVLAETTPSTAVVSNWSAAWVGLDALEAVALLGTGALLVRRDSRHGMAAAVAATLLVVDAWFDVMTATSGPERAVAAALAAGAELPLAALCAALAVRAITPGDGVADGAVNDA